jgi:Polyketide cyclase / dehydrase and lipid transport
MPEIRATASAEVPAPPAIVYGIIADYHQGHPSILPPQYFQNLTVEAGGIGAGTQISFEMRSFGQTRHVRGHVTEPEPGRRILETYPEFGIETDFTVDPLDSGQRSRVTIATRYQKAGLAGWIERLVSPVFLRTVYAAELRLLAERAAARR